MDKNQEKKIDDELISKKDLLSLTKISYGQLYRWKRMNIIPEDWFIKKSTPTGQETFFRREKILERINAILSMKDGISLDEIADLFNEKENEKTLDIDEVTNKKIVSEMTLEVFKSLFGNKLILGRKELVILNLIDKYLINSVITMEELRNITNIMEKSFVSLYEMDGKLLLYRKLGVAIIIGCKNTEEIIIDPQAVKIIEIDLQREAGEMTRKLI